MIRPSFFYQKLASYGINFYTGVPDSLLKNLCAYVTDHAQNHIIAANEGGAMGIAAGHYLATAQIPVVYMQNSGFRIPFFLRKKTRQTSKSRMLLSSCSKPRNVMP